MSAFKVQGWCPGALRPMMSGDGLVVRTRPHLARLTAAQAQGLALAALRHGNGLIDLSTRANVQLRGIRLDAHTALLADLGRLGLIDPDETTEAHRNIVVSPFWTDTDGTAEVAETVTTLLRDPLCAPLSGKFGVSVDLGTVGCLHDTSADIRITRAQNGWLLRPDSFATGAVVRTPKDLTTALHALIHWFLPQGAARMAALWPNLPQAARQAQLPQAFQAANAGPIAATTFTPGPHPLGQIVGFEFGQMRAETLAALAHSALRITPWRMVLLEGIHTAPTLDGLITAPSDPRLRVTACTGAPACPQALQPTRDLARQLAAQVPIGQHLHVSGCTKGCAHPKATDVTLTATTAGFDLIRNGRAADMATSSFDPSRPLFKAL
jgi:precorrin-3B synthase